MRVLFGKTWDFDHTKNFSSLNQHRNYSRVTRLQSHRRKYPFQYRSGEGEEKDTRSVVLDDRSPVLDSGSMGSEKVYEKETTL